MCLAKNREAMEQVRINLSERSYSILIGDGILNEAGRLLTSCEVGDGVAIISNPVVWGFYGRTLLESLKQSGFTPVKMLIPDGEKYKNLRTLEKIYGELLKAGIDRKGCIFALGGGVIGDIAGFASATYLRGIRYVQVPTTLLAQVDASIGGKTGVDHKLGKNMIGAFHQPLFVLSDIATLKTLKEREYRAGIAEVIKYGVIKDPELFEFLEKETEPILRRDKDALKFIVRRCSEIKAGIVEQDEREETGLRSILNFGHTVGHAIESATLYRRYLHGEAVALGMKEEVGISDRICERRISPIVVNLINKYFGYLESLPQSKFSKFIAFDKKKEGELIKVFLIKDIGNIDIKKIELKEFKKLLKQGGR